VIRFCPLGDYVRIEHGFAFKGEFFSEVGHFVLLTPGNFYDEGGFRLRPGKDRYYVGEIPQRYILNHGDVIVAMTEQAEGLLGSSALIPEANRYLHNQRLGLLRVKKGKADSRFLYYLFNTSLVRQQIRGSSSGTKVRHTSPERMYKVHVPLFPVEIQVKIASILSAYDDLIENNKRRIAILEKMAEEIYREWFVRMRFSSYAKATEDKPAVGKSKGLPSGWAIQRLDSFCAKVTDGTHDTPKPQIEGVPLVTGKNLHNGRVDFADTYKISEQDHLSISKRSGLTPFDILFSNIGTLGAMAVVTADINYSVKNVIIFKSKSPAHALYLYWTLRQQYHVDLMQAISSGASQQFISLGVARGYKIISPAPEILESFGRLILPVHEMIQSLYDSMEKLTSIRDLLLPRLISGKLPVENLELPSNEKLASASSALPQQGLAHA
jgi:type I restriction enzyme S subunit